MKNPYGEKRIAPNPASPWAKEASTIRKGIIVWSVICDDKSGKVLEGWATFLSKSQKSALILGRIHSSETWRVSMSVSFLIFQTLSIRITANSRSSSSSKLRIHRMSCLPSWKSSESDRIPHWLWNQSSRGNLHQQMRRHSVFVCFPQRTHFFDGMGKTLISRALTIRRSHPSSQKSNFRRSSNLDLQTLPRAMSASPNMSSITIL